MVPPTDIATIDASSLFGPPSAARKACDAAIAEAARDMGFLLLADLPCAQLWDREGRQNLLRIFALPDAEKRRRADYVIVTDTLEHARQQVQDVVRQIRDRMRHA